MTKNKTIIVTGADSGIGQTIAGLFFEKHWNVIGCGLTKPKDPNCFLDYFEVDFATEQGLNLFLKNIEHKYSEIDCLVNNAAMQICKSLKETTYKDFATLFSVNLFAPALLASHLLPKLARNAGNIVNISSVHAVATSKNIACYASSKGALATITKSMALEFGEYGVRVNAVLPGAVDTPMLESGLMRGHLEGQDLQGLKNNLGRKHVMGRIGIPRDIAQAVYFLADNDSASFITGSLLSVDGGALVRLSTE